MSPGSAEAVADPLKVSSVFPVTSSEMMSCEASGGVEVSS